MKYIILFLLLILIWSVFVEPNILTVKHLTIKDKSLNGLKLVFASDFHIKPLETLRLKRIIKKINEQNPDIILLGGDYVSGHKKGQSLPINKIAFELTNLNSKYGTFAVVGNHDGWQGKEEVISELEKNNIKVLFNNNICLEKFCIAGVDDPQTGTADVEKALAGIQKPVILLTHTPDVMPKVPETVNLTLAGHLHGGQIRLNEAIIVPSAYGKKYANGFLLDHNRKIYTTKGLGTSILPIRFNCTPEIVVIEFE